MMNKIRALSLKELKGEGIVINTNLPLIETGKKVRNIEDVAKRTLALYQVLTAAFGLPVMIVQNNLKSARLNDFVTPYESDLLTTNKVKQLQKRIESLKVLAWYIGLSNDLDITKYVEKDLVDKFPSEVNKATMYEFINILKPRTTYEAIQFLDKYYLLDWVIINATLNNQHSPLSVEDYVIQERRRALEWLLSDEDWEEVDMGT